MIVISVFRESMMLDPDNDSHKDNPFDGVDIIKIIPQIEADNGDNDHAMIVAQEFVEEWLEDWPGDKVQIDSHSVTL